MKLMNGEPLSDNHMDGSALVLAIPRHAFTTNDSIRAQKLNKLQPAKENSIFFHNYSGHWALSYLRDGVVLI